jgi:hypothetical protein
MAKKLIQEMLDSADYRAKQLRGGKAWLSSPPMRKILDSLDYLAEKHNASKSPYMDGTWNAVYLTLKDLDGLKDEGLAALLNSLLHHEPDSSNSEDDAVGFTRNYKFRWESKDPEFYGVLTVNVAANFKSDSDTCKRVIIGYREPEKEAKPIYELRCDDEVVAATPEGDTE